MNSQPKLYIAGTGVVTPVGGDTAMTAAAVNAEVSGYALSDFFNKSGQPITLSLFPNNIFDEMVVQIDEGDRFNSQHDRIIKLAILAIYEACAMKNIGEPIPLVSAMTDMPRDLTGLPSFFETLVINCQPLFAPALMRSFHSGRAAGIEAIDFAFNYLLNSPQKFLLVGGSDSYADISCLNQLDSAERLLTSNNADGFVPGEGAGFLLLTRHPELALVRNGKIIALHKPGIADEPGHLHSSETYRGDGLDQAFKRALVNHQQQNIHSIYSSMNGENHWAKEIGVAQIRNKKSFQDNVNIQHPADCYGDLGAATAPVLIALAAEHLFKNASANAHLVYSSSDTAKRGAIVVEKYNAIVKHPKEQAL